MSSPNIFGSDQNPAVPGGSVAKPLILALLALLASRYFSGKSSEPARAPAPELQPRSPAQEPTPGNILDGLGGLVKRFQQKGFGDTIDTWINTGANQDISSDQVSDALGRDVVTSCRAVVACRGTRWSRKLSRLLPGTVDKLTPEGLLPTQREMARLLS
jgi:uncharacterized protein YidB (DUF937 family)